MHNFRITSLSTLLATGALSLPLLASTASAVVATPRTSPSVGTQLAMLKGSDTAAGDLFGSAVAITGTTAVVGADGDGSSGGSVAYVFTKTGAAWTQAAELQGSDTVAGDDFGGSVAVSGTTVVVGAPAYPYYAGRAYVFTKSGSGWQQAAELKGSDTAAGDLFGSAVAITGTTALVGADSHAKESGRVYVFAETGTGWKQTAELAGSDSSGMAFFGSSVAISGTIAVVGAWGSGVAYVFTNTGAGWKQTAELAGSDTSGMDFFGSSVAISGTTAVVGAPQHAGDAGRAYVFTKTGAAWIQAAELRGSDTAAKDYFGSSVAISGTTVVVGAYGHDKKAGRAYVFTETRSGWKQAAELKGSNTLSNDWFGSSVAISGITAVVGAQGHADDGGLAYVFAD